LFINLGNEYSSTFLPEVAQDEEWDKKTTLKYLIRKSGYNGKIENILSNMKLRRYQSIKVEMSYEEYRKMK
jgi:AMMECR1 domain-containing protein